MSLSAWLPMPASLMLSCSVVVALDVVSLDDTLWNYIPLRCLGSYLKPYLHTSHCPAMRPLYGKPNNVANKGSLGQEQYLNPYGECQVVLEEASSRNILEEVEPTGCLMGSWVRVKGRSCTSCSGADVCSNTSKQRLWLGVWRSWSYERRGHTKSHKTAGGRCNFRPKFKRVYTSNTTRSLVGFTLPFTLYFCFRCRSPLFCRPFLPTCHRSFLDNSFLDVFTMPSSGASSKPKLVRRQRRGAPPQQQPPSSQAAKSWSQVAALKKEKEERSNEAQKAPGDLSVAATAGYR